MEAIVGDDLDLGKIARSGQCFRACELEGGAFRFICRDRALLIKASPLPDAAGRGAGGGAGQAIGNAGGAEGSARQAEGGGAGQAEGDGGGVGPVLVEASCTTEEWDAVWAPYFDLGRSYRDVRARVAEDDPFMREAAGYGRGLRVLRQDPWETLVEFIVSQRKSIPAIKGAVERMCASMGEELAEAPWSGAGLVHAAGGAGPAEPAKAARLTRLAEAAGLARLDDAARLTRLAEAAGLAAGQPRLLPSPRPLRAFPSPERLAAASAEELAACGLGYRVPYVQDAARRVASGELDLAALAGEPTEEVLRALMEVRGVGVKVASCVALFAYGRAEVAPVDTWIGKVVAGRYGGADPFVRYGDVAGVMQQYAFLYAIEHKGEMADGRGGGQGA